jgi:hypothetical protein
VTVTILILVLLIFHKGHRKHSQTLEVTGLADPSRELLPDGQ